MLCRFCCLLIFSLGLVWAQPAIPDTSAGRVFKTWLDAFNSGDRARMDAYYQRYEPDKSVEGMMSFRDATGGFELLSIEKSEPLHLEFRVKEKKGETTALGKLDVKEGEAAPVTAFSIRAIPKGVRRS